MTPRTVVKWMFWLTPVAAVAALTINTRELTTMRSAWTVGGFGQLSIGTAQDGSFHVIRAFPPDEPVRATVLPTDDHVAGPAFDGRLCLERRDWRLDIRSTGAPLTQAERATIAKLAFGFNGWPVPVESLTATPPPGTTVVSGTTLTRRWGHCVGFVLSGTPVVFVIGWGFAGVVLLITPPDPRESRDPSDCAGCGYSRVGLAADAPCPECGRKAAATA